MPIPTNLPVEVKGNIEKILSKYTYTSGHPVYPHNTVCA